MSNYKDKDYKAQIKQVDNLMRELYKEVDEENKDRDKNEFWILSPSTVTNCKKDIADELSEILGEEI